MNLYVAGRWSDRQVVRNIMMALTKAGHHITLDWTNGEDNFAPKHLRMVSWNDVLAIKKSEALIMVFTGEHEYRGSLVEMGIALSQLLPIYFIGKVPQRLKKCPFIYHPWVKGEWKLA